MASEDFNDAFKPLNNEPGVVTVVAVELVVLVKRLTGVELGVGALNTFVAEVGAATKVGIFNGGSFEAGFNCVAGLAEIVGGCDSWLGIVLTVGAAWRLGACCGGGRSTFTEELLVAATWVFALATIDDNETGKVKWI